MNQLDLQLFASKIYLSVIFSWPSLSQNQQLMDILDMKKNTLCIYHKEHNQELENYMIQSFVFSIMLTIWFFVSMPIVMTDIATNIDSPDMPDIDIYWTSVQQNNKLMELFDMNTNQICKYHREKYPLVSDIDIQKHVFLIVLVVMTIIATPFNIIFNGGVEYLNKSIESQLWLLNNEIQVE